MFDVIVTLFGIAMAVAPLLQVIRMIKLQASDEISIGMFCVLFIGASLWFAYGIEHSLPSIIIANGVGMVVNAMTVLVAVYFRQSRITVDIADDTASAEVEATHQDASESPVPKADDPDEVASQVSSN